ncbi:PepSY domain-containing protein [Streptomyces sp. NPDC017991]|uniref:PepSY domain-containing protein n=1 Tax=Streptomyces sp. NPDC017991 TaxID=3365026 RepID=UPI0037AAD8FF
MSRSTDSFHPGRPTTRSARTAAVAVCATAFCALLLAGCGDSDDGRSPSVSRASASPAAATTSGLSDDQRERAALIPADKTGYRKAVSTAVHEVPDGTVTALELERDNKGKPVWRATVATKDGTEHEVELDAATGKVTSSRTDSDQDGDDKRDLARQLSEAKVSSQKAVDIATGRTKGTVTSIDLDDADDGTLIWSVDIVTTDDWNKTTYDVDATNGKVVREHVDRD